MHRLICSAARIWCIALVSAVVILAAGCGGGGGGSNGGGGGSNGGGGTDTTAPVISSPSATPDELPPIGGTLTIRATVTDNVGVASVTASITKPNNTTVTVAMSISSGSIYTATWRPDFSDLVPSGLFKIVITARDGAGNTATSPQLTVRVEGPPPPPSQD